MIYSRTYYPEITNPYNVNRANNAYNYKEEQPSLLELLGLICKPKNKKPLRNTKNGCFSVIVSELLPAMQLLTVAVANGLTVKGDGTARSKGNILNDIDLGDIITFGNSEKFDVDYTTDPEYIKKNNLIPVYDILKDWDTILKAVKEMAKEKEQLNKKAGYPEEPLYRHLKGTKTVERKEKKEIVVSSTWIKIGDQLYSKYYSDNVVIM